MLDIAIDFLVHISALLGIGMFIVVAKSTQRSRVRLVFLQLLAILLVWNLGTVLELDVRLATGRTVFAFINICYIGICLLPVAILQLGRVVLTPDWRPKRLHGLFLVVPIISIIIVLTSPMHTLFFKVFSLYSSEAVYGGYYYLHSVYSYGCIATSIVLMYISSTRNSGVFSVQSLLVMSGVVITLVPNILYSFGVGNLPFSISAAASTFSILCFSIAFLRFRFIEAPPVTLRQIVDLISDGFLVLDKQVCILSYNRPLLRMFPEKSGIALGKNIRGFIEQNFPDTPYDRVLELLEQAMMQRETISTEVHTSGGSYYSLEITSVTQRAAQAQIGSIILVKDITESKQLIETTKAASRAKGDFLSHMSHEIRTPLSAIIGMINIGIGANDVEKMKYCFSRADSASKHLLSIINDILDMSKIEAEKFELSYSKFEFENMLMNITNIANVRVEEKKQNFIVNIGNDVPTYIECDELRLSQAITNLLTNAVKFTPENGTIMLNIDKTDEHDDDVTLRFEIADSGIGLSPEQQARLFTSYNQANAGISREYGGTGLGLAITKQIVELMDGKIWIESELGMGSKFIFTIKTKKLIGRPRVKLSASISPKDMRILAVDDSVEIRDYFMHVMMAMGISCNVAASGEEALQMVTDAEFDPYNIFFVDWMLPGINGIELTRRIKKIHGENSIIIMISVSEWSVIEKEAVAAGVKHFLSKPLFPSALINAINICVNETVEVFETDSPDKHSKRRYDFHDYTLLVVEDIEINREIMSAILEETDVAIDFAENGEIAVSMFTKNPDKYNLILMDIQMPVMDGYDATKAIRVLDFEFARSIPIIAMTANVFKEDIEKCIESGMNDHTGKPVDTDSLLGVLNKYLRHPDKNSRLKNFYELKNGVAWDDSLLTGNALVDMQHQRFFEWAGELVMSCERGEETEKLWDTLAFLENHAVRHFANEEALMLEINYPDFKNHKREHECFTEEIAEFVRRFDADGPTDELSQDVNKSVAKWLVQHIRYEDLKISDYIRGETESDADGETATDTDEQLLDNRAQS